MLKSSVAPEGIDRFRFLKLRLLVLVAADEGLSVSRRVEPL